MSQLKIKNGNNWVNIPASGMGVPSGGTTGQVLKKSSNTDYATGWADGVRGWKALNLYRLSVTLAGNNQTVVDFASQISASTPDGYTFDHLEFVGAWPRSTWSNAYVISILPTPETPNSTMPDPTMIDLFTPSGQAYDVTVRAWFYRDL